MSDLRNKTIRLAHEKPELRKHLLPLLKQSGEFTEKEWETHKQKYPGADPKDHNITKSDDKKDNGKGEIKREPKETIDIQQAFGAYGRTVDLEWQIKNKMPGDKKPEEIAKAVDKYKDRMTDKEKGLLKKKLKSKADSATFDAEEEVKQGIEKLKEEYDDYQHSTKDLISYIKGEKDLDYVDELIPEGAKNKIEKAMSHAKVLSDAAKKLA